jgi:hypothetical protein
MCRRWAIAVAVRQRKSHLIDMESGDRVIWGSRKQRVTMLLAFLIGVIAGLRSLTAPASVTWAAYLGRMKLDGILGLLGHIDSVSVFTVLAIAELVAYPAKKTK